MSTKLTFSVDPQILDYRKKVLASIHWKDSDLPIYSGNNIAEFSKANNDATAISMTDYRKKLQDTVVAFWDGDSTLAMFLLAIYNLIDDEYTLAWYSGIEMAGMEPGDMTYSEQLALKESIREAGTHVERLSNDLIAAKNSGDNFDKFNGRLNMWANGYLGAQNKALYYASADPKLKWVEGDTVKKCPDCLYYEGKVKRASYWLSMGIHPQNNNLACTGINCGCYFLPVNGNITPGNLRRL